MTTIESGRWLQWRRFAEDLLVCAAALIVIVAMWRTAEVFDTLVLSGALIGLALMLEPYGRGPPPDDAKPTLLRSLTHRAVQ